MNGRGGLLFGGSRKALTKTPQINPLISQSLTTNSNLSGGGHIQHSNSLGLFSTGHLSLHQLDLTYEAPPSSRASSSVCNFLAFQLNVCRVCKSSNSMLEEKLPDHQTCKTAPTAVISFSIELEINVAYRSILLTSGRLKPFLLCFLQA